MGEQQQKILSIAILQKVDKVFLVNKTTNFGDILKAMKRKIPYEIIEVKDEEKRKGFNFLNKLNK